MPYSSVSDFKSSTTYKRLVAHYRKKGGKPPADKIRQFMSVVNSQLGRGVSEQRAIASAWSAIKGSKK